MNDLFDEIRELSRTCRGYRSARGTYWPSFPCPCRMSVDDARPS